MKYKNILLIDDDEDDQEIFLTAVNEVSQSVNCKALSDAKTALEKLIVKEIKPDVIFLDLNMPKMNGREFLVALKKNEDLRVIPVIMFSTASQPEIKAVLKEKGADDFITKPERYDQLLDILRPILI